MESPLLMTTRFNDQSWEHYCDWRNRYQLSGAYYNTPLPISATISPKRLLYVLEMHNSINKIMGMGVIRNKQVIGKYYKMYDNDSLNRYHYQSKIRITRDQLSRYSILLENGVWISLLVCLEYVCFKGSRHSKRSLGIIRIPSIYFKGTIMKKMMKMIEDSVKRI